MARRAPVSLAVVSLVLGAAVAVPSAVATPASAAATPLCGSMVGKPPHITKVLWIVMENKSYGTRSNQIPGSKSAAYIDGTLLARCGSTTAYHAVTHPSQPNYFALTSGSTQGATDKLTFVTGPNLFAQVNPSWRAYDEYMPVPCDHVFQTGSTSDEHYYLGRHNPAASYSSPPVNAPSGASCTTNDIALGTTTSGALRHDLAAGTLRSFSMITPGLCNDMHMLPTGVSGCPDLIAGGDAWLKTWIPLITAGPDYRAGNLLVDVVWDEGSGNGAGDGADCVVPTTSDCIVPNIVISPYTPHVVSHTVFSHYSLLRTTERLLGRPYLGHAADRSTKDMCGDFGICTRSTTMSPVLRATH